MNKKKLEPQEGQYRFTAVLALLSFIMMNQYYFAAAWLAGFLLSYWMLKIEHEAEKQVYTQGDKVLSVLLSILSFAMVLFILIKAWASGIGAKGYWSSPVNKKTKAE